MRCIEMSSCLWGCWQCQGLTLTWDVLKLTAWKTKTRQSIRLTLTWDVLKFRVCFFIAMPQFGLTLTWDVLKYTELTIINIIIRD